MYFWKQKLLKSVQNITLLIDSKKQLIYSITMNKTLLLIFIIIIFLGSCNQIKNQETFEGTITYNITVITNTKSKDYNNYQKQKYGDKVKIHISKNGSIKREFLTSGKNGFDFFIYDALTNSYYTKWKHIDTIYSFNCIENSLTFLEEKDVPEKSILGEMCKGYNISGFDPIGGQNVSLTYFYPLNKEYINPKLYKNYNDFFYNKVIEKIQAPYYKLIMDMDEHIVIFESEKVENDKISPIIFNLPTHIPIKRQN